MRAPVLAAGGIVLRRGGEPLFAVVRMRKRNDWVLPKGKLDDGETPRQAAMREVLEETGHLVEVHEFIGTLACEAGGRTKVVHFWRMEAAPVQTHPLMKDIRAVDWLPLHQAVERLTRIHERAFLAHVGPLVLDTAARTAPPLAAAQHRAPFDDQPLDDQPLAELTVSPSLALEQPHDAQPTMLQRIRNWWRGTAR
ncbi:NUDIX hydrolase [Rhodopseudomonas palustris HaA2]|uniref:NUDIX hydrolase n=1 Tax=Rhodopseudomonas palustris (strain HaA2) TaxID=316058 RepID=Q2J191_RHOP2|nr:NUDIX hydrolase [Rhodopseudomonas palustris]ABD05769.1 NUDIX hydrolase [Rhodopseudomonas palustris HaA2]